ncbi:MAG: UDP-N-acetylmuramate dehydrogenase [Acidobacteria bacterium]|nr:UDP-N-acetylmuramate dehydrogenase [Acidobacteriota bacterium]
MRRTDAPLSDYTRFGLGGPADLLVDADSAVEFIGELQSAGGPHIVLGGGTNLVVSDAGYRGTVLRYTGRTIEHHGSTIRVESGADLEALVQYAVAHGLAGLESMMRIPGWVSGAVYGNAGAYGQSIHETLARVEIWDGAERRWLSNAECGFTYRASRFKQNKHWIILTAEFTLRPGDAAALAARAEEIRATRDEKFPPTMKCAGSIFKNCLFAQLPRGAQQRVPEKLVREGKVPAAYFLEQIGAKGEVAGGIRVAPYHANLLYNAGSGTAAQVVQLIDNLKGRVRQEFGFDLEPEVQFVGFPDRVSY